MPSKLPFPLHQDPLRQAIRDHYQADESVCVQQLLDDLHWPSDLAAQVHAGALEIAEQVREQNESHGGLDAFLHEFKLSSQEGIALMCLAEALLRVPDADTADDRGEGLSRSDQPDDRGMELRAAYAGSRAVARVSRCGPDHERGRSQVLPGGSARLASRNPR